MGKIDLTIHKEAPWCTTSRRPRRTTSSSPPSPRCRTPRPIPEKIQVKLKDVGLWDVNPLNLFRITWKNEAKRERRPVPGRAQLTWRSPPASPACPAGSSPWRASGSPTGCHKVGASFGCLAPRLVTGQFDATYHKAVWPSTGNYCRGGAFNSKAAGL